jgi:large subunit ribosomal protein L1
MKIQEAIKLVKENKKAKFDESLEVHIRTGIDPKKGEQQVRSTVVLPHGSGKTKKVAVFTENEKEAKDAGADVVGGEELIKKIKTKGVIDFEIAVATPDMMPKLAQIAKILGPKGLMPSPKNETITKDITKTVKDLKGGKVAFKNDDTSNIHQIIGKLSWDEKKLSENYDALMDAIRKSKPAGIKGLYIRSVAVCSTMGKSVKVEI